MDTRWRNTIEEIYSFIKKNWVYIPRFILPGLGIVIFGIMIAYRNSYTTEIVYGFGLTGNLCIGVRLPSLLKRYLEQHHPGWGVETELGYEEWKRSESDSFKRIYRLAAVCMLTALWYLYDLVYGNGVYGGLSRGWYYNYATGYVMVITVLVQFLLAQRAVKNFWHEKLDAEIGRASCRERV